MPAIKKSRAGLAIGALAARSGVHVETIRYYEKMGLLASPPRTVGGHRVYAEQDLRRLTFIRRSRELGFTLDDIRQLLQPARCDKTQALIEARLGDLGERMRELRHVQKVLRGALELCREHEETGRCAVVETLSARARRS